MGLGHCSVRCIAQLLTAGGTDQVYTYEFDHASMETLPEMNVGVPLKTTFPGGVLAPHSSELPYAFAAVDLLGNHSSEIHLAQQMSAAWLQFASVGDPNIPLLEARWPKYQPNLDRTMVIHGGANGFGAVQGLKKRQCNFFERLPYSVCQPQ